MIINKKLSGVLTIASSDPIRVALNAVYIKDNKAVATDGYMLMIVQLPEQQQTNIPQIENAVFQKVDELLIRSADLQRILKTIPKHSNLDPLLYGWTTFEDKEHVEFTTTDLEVQNKIMVKKVDGEFPNYEKIMPKTDQPHESVVIDINLLMHMLKAFKATGIQNNHVKITINSYDSTYSASKSSLYPVVLTAKDLEGKEVYGLIMPVREV